MDAENSQPTGKNAAGRLRTTLRRIGQAAARHAARELARAWVLRADTARNRRQYRDAATLYGEALRRDPANGPLHVQCGHMFKEAGDWAAAERHYAAARGLMPADADLALQTGHLFKLMGRFGEAAEAYRRATTLAPAWDLPRTEIGALLARTGAMLPAGVPPGSSLADHLAPELLPNGLPAVSPPAPGVRITTLGRQERTGWGTHWTLRGVAALRGVLVAGENVTRLTLRLGDLAWEQPIAGVALPGTAQRKYSFNVWVDASAMPHGLQPVELGFHGPDGPAAVHRDTVVIAPARDPEAYPDSDSMVVAPPTPLPPDALARAVNSRPSVVRPARRDGFPHDPRTILVQRIDQLGDLVCSVPAIRRLRAIFPGARLIGLVSPSNAAFAATLEVFDEIVTADVPDDPQTQRRLMPLAEQIALHERLAALDIDLAIDLATSGVSRPLLRLAGARHTYGFREAPFDWLSAEALAVTRDPVDGQEAIPHAKRVQGLVEWLAVMASGPPAPERRRDLGRGVLAPLGLTADDRFIVLHLGARLAFSRWPHFPALAARLLARTDCKVVMMSEEPIDRTALPAGAIAAGRLLLLEGRLSFDQLDGLVSFCAAFVGNDTGPKHLAAFRGAKVVSLHAARINWNEWGQEHGGLIVSRRVPCAGCAIHHHPEECGQDFACLTAITPQEVFDAVQRLLGETDRPPGTREVAPTTGAQAR